MSRWTSEIYGQICISTTYQRAKGCGRVRGLADSSLGSESLESIEVLVVNTLLDEDARARRAGLARVEPDAPGSPGCCLLDVGRVENDHGRLAAELESDLLEVGLGGGDGDLATGSNRASERDLVNVGVARDGLACNGTETGNGVDDTSGNASLLDEVAHHERSKRGELGGLHDHGAACSEGGTDLPRPHNQRVVPWDDLAAHANRLVESVSQLVAAKVVDRLAGDLVGHASIVAQASRSGHDVNVPGCQLGHSPQLTEQCAHPCQSRDCGQYVLHVACVPLNSGNLVSVAVEERGKLVQDCKSGRSSTIPTSTALRSWHLLPGALEGSARSLDSSVDILLAGLGDGDKGLAGRWVDSLKGLARKRLDPLVVAGRQHLASSQPAYMKRPVGTSTWPRLGTSIFAWVGMVQCSVGVA